MIQLLSLSSEGETLSWKIRNTLTLFDFFHHFENPFLRDTLTFFFLKIYFHLKNY